MASAILIFLVIVLALGAVGYFIAIRKQQQIAAKKISDLQVQADTARILEEHKRSQVDKEWEEYDRRQWELRFNNPAKG